MLRKLAVAAALAGATLALTTPTAVADSALPGTTAPKAGTAPKATTPYYYTWYTTYGAAEAVGKDKVKKRQWTNYAVQSSRSGSTVYYYLWYGL